MEGGGAIEERDKTVDKRFQVLVGGTRAKTVLAINLAMSIAHHTQRTAMLALSGEFSR